jgi:hypothetical protein
MKKLSCWLVLSLLFGTAFVPLGLCAEAPGERLPLSKGELYIPSSFVPEGNAIDIVFHIHGSAQTAEENLYKSGVNAVLVAFHIQGFSTVYRNYFSDQTKFQILLEEVLAKLKLKYPDKTPEIGYLCMTAFSAGYAGIREILKDQKYYDQIDAIFLADALHTNYVKGKHVDPDQMKDFLKFALDAAEGKKRFIMSHSRVEPGNYASTTECADYLTSGVGALCEEVSQKNELGMEMESKCEKGKFAIYGFKGDSAKDHMNNFYSMYLFLKEADFKQSPARKEK